MHDMLNVPKRTNSRHITKRLTNALPWLLEIWQFQRITVGMIQCQAPFSARSLILKKVWHLPVIATIEKQET